MKSVFFLFLAGLPALAAVPAKKPLVAYALLWTRSPICSPPGTTCSLPAFNPFAEWTLGGVSAVSEGYRVTLINRQQPDQQRVLRSGESDPFRIESVRFGTDSWKATTVVLNCNGFSQQLGFEDAFIRPKSLHAAPAAANAPAGGPPKRIRTLAEAKPR